MTRKKTATEAFVITESVPLYVSPMVGETPIAWLTRLTHQLTALAGQYGAGLRFADQDMVSTEVFDAGHDGSPWSVYDEDALRFDLIAERPMTPAERAAAQARRDKRAAQAAARAAKQAEARLRTDRRVIAAIKKRNPQLLAEDA